jgi:8-oxo-dGTP diphosphatase/ribosomal-protein-alanine N-acetyltransferase
VELQIEQVNELFEMYADHDTMKYRGSAPMSSINDALLMISHKHLREGNIEIIRLGIIEKFKGRLIGTLLIKLEIVKNEVEIGFSFSIKF